MAKLISYTLQAITIADVTSVVFTRSPEGLLRTTSVEVRDETGRVVYQTSLPTVCTPAQRTAIQNLLSTSDLPTLNTQGGLSPQEPAHAPPTRRHRPSPAPGRRRARGRPAARPGAAGAGQR